MSKLAEIECDFNHPAANQAEIDCFYGAWDISYSDQALNIDDLRTYLFLAIALDDYEKVLDAVARGADPNSVFMPTGPDIELPDFDNTFVNTKSCDWVHKYGMTAVGLCVATVRPAALRGLIDSGAAVEDAYFISMKFIQREGRFGFAPAFDFTVIDELKKVKSGWRFVGKANGVIFTGDIRSEIINQSWEPMFRGKSANKNDSDNDRVLGNDKCSETEEHNKEVKASNPDS